MPASLGCGHTFCKSCIYTLAVRVCPVCRQPFSVTDDMRRLHVDLESRSSRDITNYEMKMLESCRSGDLSLMEKCTLEVERWLESQPSGFRCSLPTMIELVRLLMEATSQLHEALERSQMDEKSLRMRQELDSMKEAAERRRLQQETEALRNGMLRQREHLAYLESELAKAKANTVVSAPQVPIVVEPIIPPAPKRRPALPTPPELRIPLQISNSPNLTPRTSWVIIESPTEENRPAINEPPKPAPLSASVLSAISLTEPIVRRKSRSGLQGPRDRTTPKTAEPVRPSGAAPSAFSPERRPSLSSSEFGEPARAFSHDSRRTSLPSTGRPQALTTTHSYEAPTRRQRFSVQPTSWRPLEISTSYQDTRQSSKESEESFLPYLSPTDSHESTTPTRPARSQPPSNIDSPSLSRKRALRRQSKDYV